MLAAAKYLMRSVLVYKTLHIAYHLLNTAKKLHNGLVESSMKTMVKNLTVLLLVAVLQFLSLVKCQDCKNYWFLLIFIDWLDFFFLPYFIYAIMLKIVFKLLLLLLLFQYGKESFEGDLSAICSRLNDHIEALLLQTRPMISQNRPFTFLWVY